MIELSRYEFEILRTDEEFNLYRARGAGEPSSILVLTPVLQQPEPGTIKRLEHECSFRDELDPEWSVRPIGLTRHWDRMALVLEDPGGEPLYRLLGPVRNTSPRSVREALRARTSTLADAGGQPMELAWFLRLAISLAAGLSKLHGRGLIHKDIKPANVLVGPVTNKVWFTGFGISSRLVRERQAPEPPEMIAGTLAYMAPEQTGRMNRSVDSRSDLYSLGVTFYQMLTGCLPFTASDPMEWVHCHIARKPAPPGERIKNVPAPVSAIIMKLLAKTAEERYETASGLEADLSRCLPQWETRGCIDDFPLGEKDKPDRLLIPEKLYGRAREIDTLLTSFDRVVASGRPELVLISGYSGMGKSSVVNELHKVLVPSRGLFASGKFDQYKRDIPYSTLAQAFQSLIRPLLAKKESELDGWRAAFREALGPNGQLMVDLVPELKLIIGEQAPVPDLPPQDTQRRFQLVVRRFISVFARPEHPLVLFLDDLQWLDMATLDLLEDLLISDFAGQRSPTPRGLLRGQPIGCESPKVAGSTVVCEGGSQPVETKLPRTGNLDVHYLMLIGAYRNNEVGATHPLTRKLDAVRQTGAQVHEIRLWPLARDDLRQLIADSVRCEPERAAPLAQLVHQKTGGNPFFAIQFISALAEEGLLTFERHAGRWSWDVDGIHAKGYTDNVVDLMVAKLQRLPVEAQEALQQLACLGNIAGVATLSIVLETRQEEVQARLWDAVHQELIVPLKPLARPRQPRSVELSTTATLHSSGCEDNGSTELAEVLPDVALASSASSSLSSEVGSTIQVPWEGVYRFIHDRIQEAAYSLIPEELRAEAHLRIGRLLAAHTPAEKREGAIFEIVNQLNRGAVLITAPEEREQLAELNLIAGKRAKVSTAYASALTHFVTGAGLLAEDCWERRHELMFALELHRAECEFLTGALTAAEERLAVLAIRAANTLERATVACLRMDLYTTLDQASRAVAVGLEYLRHLGIDWSPHPTAEEARREYDRIWKNLGNRAIEELIELPLMSEPASLATLDVLTKVLPPVMFTDGNLACLVVCRAVNLSLERGNCDGSCYAYVRLGVDASARFGDYRAAYRFGQLGHDLVERRGLRRFQARTYVDFGNVILPLTKHVRAGRDLVRHAFETANKIGDLTFAAYCCIHLIENLLAAGDPLVEAQREAENGLAFAQKLRFGLVSDIISLQLGLIRTLRGLTPKFGSFDDEQFNELWIERRFSENADFTPVECLYWLRKLQARFLGGDYTAGVNASLRAQPLLWTPRAALEVAEYHFYGALSRAAVCDPAVTGEYQQHVAALAAHHRQLEIWAENCPENFENRAALVGAEIARLEGRDLDAMRLYEESIRSARENGFVQNEGIANELVAQFYLKRGIEKVAHSCLQDARYCYLRWGALGKVKQLDERYPGLAEQASVRPTTTIGAPVEQLDLGTVMKASHALSGEIVLEKLIKTLMVIALELAGAERGLLILPHGEEHRIAAEVRTGRDGVEVQLQHALVTLSDLPDSLLRYVIRTQESVILDDASVQSLFSEDPYVLQKRPRSVLCLPLVKQTKLIGALYLENNLAPRVFTPKRLAMLELLASQAAISLDHARLYADLGRLNAELSQENSERRKAEEALRHSEERWRKLFENSSAGIALTTAEGHFIAANPTFQKILDYTEAEFQELNVLDVTHEDDRPTTEKWIAEASQESRRYLRYEKRFRRRDGNVIWADISTALVPATGSTPAFFAAVIVDITERKRAEEELRRSEAYLAQGERIGHTGSWGWHVSTGEVYWSKEHFRIFDYDPETTEPSYSLFMERIHPEDRFSFKEILNRAVRDKSDFEYDYRIVLPDGSIKFLRSVGQALVNPSGDLEFIGTVIDITDLKRLEEMRTAMAREREMLAQHRATELAKANDALRRFLDALASVPELDDFLGRVMAAITQQLGAVSSTLRVRNFAQNTLPLELVFQDGQVMSPTEAKYPENHRSLPLDEERRSAALLDQPTAVIRVLDPHAPIPDEHRSYLRELGVKTVLIIPLTSRDQVNGRLDFRFNEERNFDPEELEIARALATQASLAIQLTRLAKTARQSALLEERYQLAAEIHDSLAQSFTGISMQLEVAGEQLAAKEGDPLCQIQRANEIAKFGLAQARRSILSLRSSAIEESGLTATLQRLVERSNVAGRLRCDFRANRIPEQSLPARVQHEMLRIAQEAISNAVRHAKATVVSVTLRWNPPNLILQVKDNGSGISRASLEKREGFGLSNMRTRASQIDGELDIQTAAGHGTSIVLTVPISL